MIVFKKLRFKNILAVGNYWIEVDLDRYGNIVISGTNGTGKSTLLDAFCFCLFNRPFRPVNKGDIINALNGKLLTEVELEKDGDLFLIRRGQKPNIFQIIKNDVELKEDSHARDFQKFLEFSILQMDFKTFTQTRVIGSAIHTPFMQLKTPERRVFVESILDLAIFSLMNVLAKQKLADLKDTLKTIDLSISKKEVEIEAKEKYIQKVEADAETKIKSNNIQIEHCQQKMEEQKKSVLEFSEKLSKIDIEKINLGLSHTRKKETELSRERGGLEYEIREGEKRIKFFSDNTSCPTCYQEISMNLKESVQKSVTTDLSAAQISLDLIVTKELALEENRRKLEDAITKIKDIQNSIQRINQDIQSTQNRIKDFQDENTKIQKLQDLVLDIEELKTLQVDYKKTIKEKESALHQKSLYELSIILLKDTGVKAEIIKSYIPLINKLINEFLSKLELFLQFELNENFEESLMSRHVDNRKYFSFSEGEKARIDIAILFAFREIARRRNVINTNTLIIDEIFTSALDEAGTDALVKMLKGLDSNNIIISHNEKVLEQFNGRDDLSIVVTKPGNFSYYNF